MVMQKLSDKRIRELERAEKKLQALEAGGVDNWEWYSESLTEYHFEESYEELLDEFTQSFQELIAESEVSPEDSRNGLYLVTGDEDGIRNLLDLFKKSFKELEDDL